MADLSVISAAKNKMDPQGVYCPILCYSRPPCQAVVYCPQQRHRRRRRLRLTIHLFDNLPITSFNFSNQLEGIGGCMSRFRAEHSPTYFVLRMHVRTPFAVLALHMFSTKGGSTRFFPVMVSILASAPPTP